MWRNYLKLNIASKLLIVVWSIPMITLTILFRAARLEAENFQGDGQQLAALFILALPWYIAIFSVLLVLVFSAVHFIKKKRQGLTTIQVIFPFLIVILTLTGCLLIDGNSIASYFTKGNLPFIPPDPVY